MSSHRLPEGKNDEWLTPPEILKALGEFDLDPCAPIVRPWDTAKKHFTIEDDGLSKEWFGRVWLNPPFNRFQRPRWMAKMSNATGTMLVPAATETHAFFKWVWGAASAVCFLEGRPHFYYVDGRRADFNAGASICLVGYGEEDAVRLEESGLGKTIRLS
jgi:hypothetical protein